MDSPEGPVNKSVSFENWIGGKLSSNLYFPDSEFVKMVEPILREMSKETPLSPLLQKLKDLPQHPPHQGLDPLQHTIKAVESLDTSTLTRDEQTVARVTMIYHDCGEANDTYLQNIGLKDNQVQRIINQIANHDLLGKLARRHLRPEAIKAAFPNRRDLEIHYRIALADIAAIPGLSWATSDITRAYEEALKLYPKDYVPIINVNTAGLLVHVYQDVTQERFNDVMRIGLKTPKISGNEGYGYTPDVICFSMVSKKNEDTVGLTGLNYTIAVHSLGPHGVIAGNISQLDPKSNVAFIVNPKYFLKNRSFIPVGRNFLPDGPLYNLGRSLFSEAELNEGGGCAKPRWDDEVEYRKTILPQNGLIGMTAYADFVPHLVRWMNDAKIPQNEQLPIYDHRGVLLYDPQSSTIYTHAV